MSDTLYNVRQYVSFTANEFLALIVTSVCIAFALSARDLLFERFKDPASVVAFGLMFIFVLFIMLVIVYVCKIIGIRLGHVVTYRAHLPGLAVGLGLTIMSAGYLPIFLPGGFLYDQPERLRTGKWLGFHKGWEFGVIAAAFPIVALFFILLWSPLYLTTKADLYLQLIIASCLIAFYACIPLPFIQSQNQGRMSEIYRHFRGATFGLDVIYAGLHWYYSLLGMVVFFALLAFIMTLLGLAWGFLLYLVLIVVAGAGLWMYQSLLNNAGK